MKEQQQEQRFEHNNNLSNATMSDTIVVVASLIEPVHISSLVEFLRKVCYNHRWTLDDQKALNLLIDHQHEFPMKIRQVIRKSEDELQAGKSVVTVMNSIYDAAVTFFLGRPINESTEESTEEEEFRWYGPDVDVDTEEEIEVAIRFFPHLLREARSKEGEWAEIAIQAATTSLKALPFVPLMAELGNEYHIFKGIQRGGLWESYDVWEFEDTVLHQIFTNKIILEREPKHNDEFYRKIDDVSLSVLMRLKEKGFFKKEEIWECTKFLLNETPVRTEKRLRYMIHWDPTILRTHNHQSVEDIFRALCNSLLEVCVWNVYLYRNMEGMLDRFKSLIELGLMYYPEEIGFLFHKDNLFEPDPKPAFPTACDLFGKDKVVKVVNDCISRYTRGRVEVFQNLVFTAATKEEMLLDGLYLLIRRDPAELIPLVSKNSKKTTNMKVEKKMQKEPNYLLRFPPLLLLLICVYITITVWASFRYMNGNETIKIL